MPPSTKLDTHEKALALNLDGTVFGSFAEIGAGQEVARWFFRVGGASGTVAKTISAYDKEVSDHLYGSGTRYVSKPRLQAMLDNEWVQLLAQLQPTRGANTKFFSFVDTVSARNYAGTNDCHGWVGLRFLKEPNAQPSDVIVHVNLRDLSNELQQEAMGILGVNLLYAVSYRLGSREAFFASLWEDLHLRRLEIDCFEVRGPAFEEWDESDLQCFLVANGYTEAVAFSADKGPAPPNELLYKRALVLAPGIFESATEFHAGLIRDTLSQLPQEEIAESKGGLGVFCISVPHTKEGKNTGSAAELMKRVETLISLGFGVLLFRSHELYRMSAFVNRYTKSRVHFAIGLTVLMRVLEDQYQELPGALLEGVARLFTQNVRVTVFPMPADELRRRLEGMRLAHWKWEEANGFVSADHLHPSGPIGSLYQYLLDSQFILSATRGGK